MFKHLNRYHLASFALLVLAFAVMPDGPWWQEIGAAMLAGFSKEVDRYARRRSVSAALRG